jgi:tripartite tricarboxylate transporter TctB family protein
MKTDTFIGIFLLLFALVLYFVLIPVYIKPSPYGDVQERIVSSKFLPTVTAWAVGLLSLIMIFQTEFGKKETNNTSPLRIKTEVPIVLGILLCIAYIILMHVFGFIISTLLVLAGLLTLFGERHPVKIILISICTTAFFYFIFAKLLMVVFPSGILFY